MRRTVRTVTVILFVAIVGGCGFAVLYLGTSTGLTFGGSGSQLFAASKSNPVYAQVGWLRNTAPWPVTIQSITTNAIAASGTPTVYLEREQSGTHVSTGTQPNWALNASHPPYDLDGGALRYLGFALRPGKKAVAYMTSITVHFTGPFGIPFTSTFKGTTVVAAASTLPAGIFGRDPTSDSTSLDAYVAALRNVLLSPSPTDAAAVMGGGATAADGAALLKLEEGYATSDSVQATPDPDDRRHQKVVFYVDDPVKGGLPPISVQWSGYRWTVVHS
jgi:hypothetical protein